MSIKSSHWLLGIILTIVAYTVIILISDFSILKNNLQNIKLEYVFLGVLAVFAGLVVRALRWNVMVNALDIQISMKSCLAVYFCGTTFGLSPGRLGEVMKSHYLKRLVNAPVSKTAPTIIVERFLDVFAILIIAITSFLLIGIKHEVILLGYLSLGVFMFLIYEKKYLKSILEKFEVIPIVGGISKKIISSLDIIYLLLKPKIFIKMLLLSVFSWFFESFVVYFVLKSFDIEISIIKSAFIFVISSLVGAASFLPAGAGATEGGLFALLFLEGIPYNEAVAPILVIRIIVVFLVIILGITINRISEATILKNK
jgi:uncharacterized protein (TIRG00374 family)